MSGPWVFAPLPPLGGPYAKYSLTRIALAQWFSTFLGPRPFSTIPNVVATPTLKLFSLLRHNCNVAAVMNRNA